MATSMQRRTTPTGTFGLFPFLTRDIDMLQSNMRRLFQAGSSARGDIEVDLPEALAWVPPVEISESDDELMITAEVPGAAADEVHVTIDGDMLTIRGEKKDERREGDEKAQYYLVERSYGAFQRSFTLPSTVDPDSIQADFNNGVLKLRLKKRTTARPRGREVPISSNGGGQSRVGSGSTSSRGASGSSGASGSAQSQSGSSEARSGAGSSSGSSSGSQSGSSSGRGSNT